MGYILGLWERRAPSRLLARPEAPWPPDLVLSFSFLNFGLRLGLGGAGLGHSDGLLALGIVPSLLQGPLAGFGASAPITRPPALKLVFAVG